MSREITWLSADETDQRKQNFAIRQLLERVAENSDVIDGETKFTYYEPGGLLEDSPYGAALFFDMTDVDSVVKHAISMDIRVTDTGGGTINTNGILIDIFTPPDNGGDVSGIFVKQTGAGNAGSLFNLSAQRPGGYTEYADNGFALEAQVDGGKHSIFTSALNGFGLLSVVRGTGGGVGVLPSADTDPTRRAFHVGNAANTVEKFYVDFAGTIFTAGDLEVDGDVDIGGSLTAGSTTITTSSTNALVVSNTLDAAAIGGITVIAPNLTPGRIVGNGFGVATSTRNQATLDFSYVGSGSTSNSLRLGLFGQTILELVGDNSAVFAGSVQATDSVHALTNTAIPAGGTAGSGYKFSSTTNFGVFFGSGAPSLSAAKGSLYLRSDGSSTSTRMYVNTDGSTTWTSVTTAA